MAKRKNKKAYTPTTDEGAALISYLKPKIVGGKKIPFVPYVVGFTKEPREHAGAYHRYTACSSKKWSAPGVKVGA